VFVGKDLLVNQKNRLESMNRSRPCRLYVYSDALILVMFAVKDTLAFHTRRLKELNALPGIKHKKCNPVKIPVQA
jgi:hypothetical protein